MKIVYSYYVLDISHKGHINMMKSISHELNAIEDERQYMKSIGGELIVMPYFLTQSLTNI